MALVKLESGWREAKMQQVRLGVAWGLGPFAVALVSMMLSIGEAHASAISVQHFDLECERIRQTI